MNRPPLRNLSLSVLSLLLICSSARGQIYVANNSSNTIGEYDETTGAAINVSCQGAHLRARQLNQALPHEGVDTMHGSVVQTAQLRVRDGRSAAKESHHFTKPALRNVRTF